MSIWEAVLLGVVQGVTEFLPISSTAHLLLVRTLLGHKEPEDAFTTVIQLGTLVAVFAYFRSDIAQLAQGFVLDVVARRIGVTPHGRLAWLILIGSIPAGIVGLTLKKWLKSTFFNLPAIAWVSIVFALLLALAEWWAHRRHGRPEAQTTPGRSLAQVGVLDSLWVGLWQALALMPGGSRSGTTITGGLFAGLSRPAAARFSFLLSLPIILAAGLKELYDERAKLLGASEIGALVVGLIVSAVVGYLSIAWLLHFLNRYSTAVFVVYRLLLGGAILGLLAAGIVR
jgi:undecaprenyl-diphosphatase